LDHATSVSRFTTVHYKLPSTFSVALTYISLPHFVSTANAFSQVFVALQYQTSCTNVFTSRTYHSFVWL